VGWSGAGLDDIEGLGLGIVFTSGRIGTTGDGPTDACNTKYIRYLHRIV